MKNKKGFTLIELLAVIVILAILMVIAVPKILNVIENARANAWENSTALVKHAIEVNTQTPDPSTGTYKYTVSDLCSDPSKINEIAKVGDMTISCDTNTNVFTLNGTNKFEGKKSTIICDASGKCSIDSITNNNSGSGNEQSGGDSSIDTSLYDYDGNRIIGFTEDNYCLGEPNLVVPSTINGNTITSFKNNGGEPDTMGCGYESIVFPDTIETIGQEMFSSNTELTSVTFGSGLKTIENNAFDHCAISSLTFPSGLLTIGDYAFAYNNLTTNITIPASVTTIGTSAFVENDLTSVTISSGVTTIGTSAFGQNENLTTIVNNTGRSFNWCDITGIANPGDDGCIFVTGTLNKNDRTISIISNN